MYRVVLQIKKYMNAQKIKLWILYNGSIIMIRDLRLFLQIY